MMHHRSRGVLVVAATALVTRHAAGQPAPIVRVAEENDYLDFRVPPDRRPDDNYTQGIRLTVGTPRVVGWGRFAPRLRACGPALAPDSARAARCGVTTWEVGQLIFTPTRDAATPQPGERPYAGWLYGSMTARVESVHDLTLATLTAGVTGPPSGAESVQTGFHTLAGFRHPAGWAYQIPTELAGSVSLEQRRLLLTLGDPARRVADLSAAAAGTVGTVRTAASGMLSGRVGYGLAHPWRTGDRSTAPVSVFGVAGVRVDAVARDLFLDGSTFGRSPRVTKEPLTSDWEWGGGVRVAHIAAEYRLIEQGREYRTGPAVHPVGVLSLSLVP